MNSIDIRKTMNFLQVVVIGGAPKKSISRTGSIGSDYFHCEFRGIAMTVAEAASTSGRVIPAAIAGKSAGLSSMVAETRNIFATGSRLEKQWYNTISDLIAKKQYVEETITSKDQSNNDVTTTNFVLDIYPEVGVKIVPIPPTKQFHWDSKANKLVMTMSQPKINRTTGELTPAEQMVRTFVKIVFFVEEIDMLPILIDKEKERVGVVLSAEQKAELEAANAADSAAKAE